jgi:hypothetical protein
MHLTISKTSILHKKYLIKNKTEKKPMSKIEKWEKLFTVYPNNKAQCFLVKGGGGRGSNYKT